MRTRLEPAQARAIRAIHVTPAAKGGCPLGGRVPLVRAGPQKQETESRSKDLNSVSAVRTRLENQLEHPLQTLAGMLSIAYLCG